MTHRPEPPQAYRLAGVRLVTNLTHPSLAVYAGGEPAAWTNSPDPPLLEETAETIFDGQGLIGDGFRRVVCRAYSGGYELVAEGLGRYFISYEGRIDEAATEAGVDPELLVATGLGAPLILALALGGTFAIHASVIVAGERLVAFIGESGAGKSTLARYLDRYGLPGWRRVIDDTLPLSLDVHGTCLALPHFPQLKLPAEMQPVHLVAEQLPLAAVYVLEASPAETSTAIRVARLSAQASTLALLQHTVGGRLFGRPLLARHLSFCARVAEGVPVSRLYYPRTFEWLPAVRDALAADLQ